MKDIIPKDYGVILNEIKQHIRSAQYGTEDCKQGNDFSLLGHRRNDS